MTCYCGESSLLRVYSISKNHGRKFFFDVKIIRSSHVGFFYGLIKKMEEGRKCKIEFKNKYESLMLKKKFALYLICIVCLWIWFN